MVFNADKFIPSLVVEDAVDRAIEFFYRQILG